MLNVELELLNLTFMGNKENNIILIKTLEFAVRIVNLYKYLTQNKQEYVLSKQILKSGTSIGANVREATEGVSRADFKNKIYTALKESRETEYWLELLYRTEFITYNEYLNMNADCDEIIKILVSIAKTISE